MSKKSIKNKGINNLLIFLAFLSVVLWFTGLYLLIKYWDNISKGAAVIASIGLVSGFSPLTIVVVLASKKDKENYHSTKIVIRSENEENEENSYL